MKTGAIIVAAGMSTRMKQFKQLMKIGNLTMAERVVMNFKNAGIQDIVMVTGYRSSQLRKSLEYLSIEFVENEDYEHTEMFESAKLGFEHLKDRCDRIVFCPVDIPFFKKETVDTVVNHPGKIVIPRHEGRKGHPIALDRSLLPLILSYQGDRGLKGAVDATGIPIDYVDVDDPGALMDADTKEDYERLVDLHNKRLMKPVVKLGIETTRECFGPLTAQLLQKIEETGSVKEGCKYTDISYSKGWAIINLAEAGLGYRLVERVIGGKYGGEAYLTDKGKDLLKAYMELDQEIQEIVRKKYSQIF